jgi:thiamine transporter ThiT
MNFQALFDGLLAATALTMAWQFRHRWPALQLACALLGIAATLGALRFSGVLPLPAWHQFFSMLGAGVGLPLLAWAATQPASALAAEACFAWIAAVVAAVLCILVVLVGQWKPWTSVCALAAAIGWMVHGLRRGPKTHAFTGLLLLLTLLAFANKTSVGSLLPGDLLHIGLTLTLLRVVMHMRMPDHVTAAQNSA